jgi:hypothetical protein
MEIKVEAPTCDKVNNCSYWEREYLLTKNT